MICVDCAQALTQPTMWGAICQPCADLADRIYPGGAPARIETLTQQRTKP